MRPVRAKRCLLGVGVLLAGCAVGPDYHPPTPVLPAHYATSVPAAQNGAPVAAWWRSFADPQLDALQRQAWQQNQSLQAAWARVQQAQALAGVSAAADWPQLSMSAQQSQDHLSTRSEQFANLPLANPQHQFSDTRVGLSASWELDVFGYRARTIEAARARLGGTEALARATALTVAAEVARHYLDLRAQQQQRRLALRQVQLAVAQQALIGRLQQAGLVSMVEVAQADGAVQNARAAVPPLQASISEDLAALAVLTGQTLQALDAGLLAEAPLPEATDVIGVGVPSDLLQRRPDVAHAERALAAASADIGVATAAQFPRFSLSAALGVDAVHQGQLGEQAARFWSFGPGLTLPLFTGGALTSQRQASEAAYTAALADYRQVVLQALADTESALQRFTRTNARQTALLAARQAADASLALIQRRVALGDAAELEALQAASAQTQAESAWLSARAARAQALVGLYQSLGGGLAVD